MTLPDSVAIEIDDLHADLLENMDADAEEAVVEFVENGLTDRVTQLVEEAIYKRYQADKR